MANRAVPYARTGGYSAPTPSNAPTTVPDVNGHKWKGFIDSPIYQAFETIVEDRQFWKDESKMAAIQKAINYRG